MSFAFNKSFAFFILIILPAQYFTCRQHSVKIWRRKRGRQTRLSIDVCRAISGFDDSAQHRHLCQPRTITQMRLEPSTIELLEPRH